LVRFSSLSCSEFQVHLISIFFEIPKFLAVDVEAIGDFKSEMADRRNNARKNKQAANSTPHATFETFCTSALYGNF